MTNYEHAFCEDNRKAFDRYRVEAELRRIESEIEYCKKCTSELQGQAEALRKSLNALPR